MTDLELRPEDTAVLVIDIQERLMPAMHADLAARVTANVPRLAKAAELFRLPVVISEQYPKGLGPTMAPVREAFAGAAVLEKSCFDAAKDDGILATLRAAGRRKIVVLGMETHVCVYQTVRSLVAAGSVVHVVSDAVASRTRENFEVGLDLARRAGAIVTSTEVVLFDLVQRAGTEEFRAISKAVR